MSKHASQIVQHCGFFIDYYAEYWKKVLSLQSINNRKRKKHA